MTGDRQAASASERHQSNAAAWNQTADWYREKVRVGAGVLRAGESTLHTLELRTLQSLGALHQWCDCAIHLQCAAGLDTCSLANLGAGCVVGVDIAEDLVELARGLAQELDAPARFIHADVLDVPHDLDGVADLVYTGKGAVHWIFDLKAWARTVARLLRPGGCFLLFDFHPMMWLFRADQPTLQASGVSYFAPVLSYREWPVNHIGDLSIPVEEIETKRLRPWPPSAVIQSLVDAGLTLRMFGEYPDTLSDDWSAYPLLADSERRKVATTYSVLASKPREVEQ